MLTVNSEFQNLFGLKDFVEEIKRPSWSLVEELMYYYRKIKGGSHPFDTSRGALSPLLQKVTMPDSSWKLIGIPI